MSLAGGNRLTLESAGGRRRFAVDRDWRPLAFSRTGTVGPAEVVFAGYGIVAPASGRFPAYDSYAKLDVKDKWVAVFRYMPEDVPPEYRQHLSHYFELRYKAMLARDKGARGLILVSGPNAKVKDQLVKLTFDTALAGSSLGAISVTDRTAGHILRCGGKGLKQLQDALDRGEQVEGFACKGTRLTAVIGMQQERRTGRNVLARLAAGKQAVAQTVVIGAHVDHIGRGTGFDSLARPEEQGKIHYGADDNASGVAALLDIARALTQQKAQGGIKLQRDVLFAAWSGEELGLLGSSHFVRKLGEGMATAEPLRSRIAAYLNMDMIGRLDKALYLQGVGSSPVWLGEIERHNVALGLPAVPQTETYLPTDATSFYLKGVPVLNAFTGAHADYNTPRDTAEKLNYDGAARITQLMGAMTLALATRERPPDYIATAKPAGSPSRRNLRAYLGTIPEYGQSSVKGVKLTGVADGGPAAQAGLLAGDVIIELAGRKIESLYDYTYALNAVKVGQPVKITVLRGAEPVSVTVIPASRD